MAVTWYVRKKLFKAIGLKGIYDEIVDEARPLSGIVPTHADSFTEIHL